MQNRSLLKVAVVCMAVIGALALAQPCAAKQIPRITNFVILVDQSDSMLNKNTMTTSSKATASNSLLMELVDYIPELGYNAALQQFSPEKRLIGPSTFDRSDFKIALAKLRDTGWGGATTPLGPAIDELDRIMNRFTGKTAVILVSDGVDNRGGDPVAAARRIHDAYPGLCFHVISMAGNPGGERNPVSERTLNEISQLGPCAYADGRELLADRQKREAFVRDIFYVEVPEAATPTAAIEPPPIIASPVMRAPATVPAPVPPALVTFPMAYFAFNKSGLNDKTTSMLDQVAGEMGRNSGQKILVGGHTDSRGSAVYNQNLSERRAKAAYDYLLAKGIAADRMQLVGYGERMPQVSNLSAEGRASNRRVEVTIRN